MNLRRAGIFTLAMIWTCTLWRASADGGDAVVGAAVNLVLFTLLVGACVWIVRCARRRN